MTHPFIKKLVGGFSKAPSTVQHGPEYISAEPPGRRLDAFLPEGVDGSVLRTHLPGNFGNPYFDISRIPAEDLTEKMLRLNEKIPHLSEEMPILSKCVCGYLLASLGVMIGTVVAAAAGIDGNNVSVSIVCIVGGLTTLVPFLAATRNAGRVKKYRAVSFALDVLRKIGHARGSKELSYHLPPENEAMVLGCSKPRWETLCERFELRDDLTSVKDVHEALLEEHGQDVARRAGFMFALHAMGEDRHLRFENVEDDASFLRDLAEMMSGNEHPNTSSRVSIDVSRPFTKFLRNASFYRLSGAPLPVFADAMYLMEYFSHVGKWQGVNELWSSVVEAMETGETDSLEKAMASVIERSFGMSEEDAAMKSLVELQLARIIGKRIRDLHETLEPGTAGMHAIELIDEIDGVEMLVSKAEERLASLEDGIRELVDYSGLADVRKMLGSLRMLKSVYSAPSSVRMGVQALQPKSVV